MKRAASVGLATLLLSAAPAWAASRAFPDVDASHWARAAVEEMAIKRTLMRAFADGTFRGEQPLTRVQLAQSLDTLLWDLEGISKTSWEPDGPSARHALSDVRGPARYTVVKLVNRYRLWDGVPGITPDRFGPDARVSRSEVAQVVKNLLERGEAKGVVRPVKDRVTDNPYHDLTPSEWAYQAILANNSRYRVMIGFPDKNFRPRESLTRYQYAAVGAASFPLVRELVRRSVQERDRERAQMSAAPLPRPRNAFQEQRPVALTLGTGTLGGPLGLSTRIRGVAYPGGDLFAMAELDLGLIPLSGGSLTLGAFPRMPALGLPGLGSLHLQPYVGIAPYVTGSGTLGVALPLVGGIGYLRTGPVGLYAMASVSGATLDTATGFNPALQTGLSLGAEYVLAPNLSLMGGLGVAGMQAGLRVAPTLGVSFGL